MKATGIVRRIDDLGRVVIPKEIRRTLRIREGEPLEIYTDEEGGVVLKKYSPIGELSEFANQYAESLFETSGYIACVTDNDSIIAISGAAKREYLEKNISRQLSLAINKRKMFDSKQSDNGVMCISENDSNYEKYTAQMIAPIIADGDVVGSIGLLSLDSRAKMGEVEQKLVESASTFLGRQLEQ